MITRLSSTLNLGTHVLKLRTRRDHVISMTCYCYVYLTHACIASKGHIGVYVLANILHAKVLHDSVSHDPVLECCRFVVLYHNPVSG